MLQSSTLPGLHQLHVEGPLHQLWIYYGRAWTQATSRSSSRRVWFTMGFHRPMRALQVVSVSSVYLEAANSLWEFVLTYHLLLKTSFYAFVNNTMRLPPKCKMGKVLVKKKGRIKCARGTTNRGKKNLTNLRKPQKPIKSKLLDNLK